MYGHDIGDEALKFFAEKVVGVLRNKYDIVIRIHGDEFVIILPECNSSQAKIVKKKIKNELTMNPFTFAKEKLTLHTSVGIAMALDRRKVSSPKDLLIQADKAMYAEKKEGRASWHP